MISFYPAERDVMNANTDKIILSPFTKPFFILMVSLLCIQRPAFTETSNPIPYLTLGIAF
ncbi:MAG: hypothetical protein A2293_00795 [Elusimicrobia bacterium RIFOXYB2_FULL_49_7]|nr:MAG: hypothetical protein A2293_00795 [Elusimicrobia bacterium RIFOXYB2_FULL_49_7]